MSDKSKLTTESYKGVRDFYPEDLFVQKHIFSTWKKVVESFGYVEYGASILESADLYKAKTGEEIANEQTYTFLDRGEREVTLRPEMTPTIARMIAGKIHNLTFPLRWYSIPNLFRYEKPQRGRLREHWQLNVDLFGVEGSEADCEIMTLAYEIMRAFGAKDDDFILKVNSRKVLDDMYKHFKLDHEQSHTIAKILDKKSKISKEAFEESIGKILGEKSSEFINIFSSKEKLLGTLGEDNKNVKELVELIEKLDSIGIKNVVFEPTLMRGFDYYTGIVFEVFDTDPKNQRSLFGGGRYDDILDIFGSKKVPAIGFGAGDVTIQDFLETHGFLPKYKPSTDIYICTLDKSMLDNARSLAETLRKQGLNVSIDLSGEKVSGQLKIANKQGVPYVIVIGEDEIKTGLYGVKNMESGEEKKVKIEEIHSVIKK
ncbi:MAG: histidine--tRNA ligase [Minisyncoccia bacterium]